MKVFISEEENYFVKHKVDSYINIVIRPPKGQDFYEHLHRIYEGTFDIFCGSKSWNYNPKNGVVTMRFEMKNDIGQLIKILSWYDGDTKRVNTYGH
jgi:hypothetical protein